MKELTKESVSQWLDKQIKIKEIFNANRDLGDSVKLCLNYSDSGIHMYSGIDVICNILGLHLMRVEFDPKHGSSSEVVYEYYFYYKSNRFFELVSESQIKEGVIVK